MALRWHVPLPGPFTASGNVVPRGSSKALGAFIVAGLIATLVAGSIYFIAVYWWAILIAIGATFGGLFVIFFTLEVLKDRKAKAAWLARAADSTLGAEGDAFVKRSAQRLAEQYAAEPHGPGGTR